MANIRTARRSGLVLRGGVQRRETLWIPTVAWEFNSLAVNSVNLIDTFNAAALALRPFTIVRTRGYLHIHSDQFAATEDQAITYGEIVVSDQAVAAGAASIPAPEANAGSDFHVFEQLVNSFLFLSAVGTQVHGFGRSFDSKAMRKVDLGEDLAIMIEVGISGVSEGVTVTSFSKRLVKLH